MLGAITPSTEAPRLAVFVQRLLEAGWAEGRNIVIEFGWAEGRSERFAEIADEIVRLNADVIVTYTTPPYLQPKGNIDRPDVRYSG